MSISSDPSRYSNVTEPVNVSVRLFDGSTQLDGTGANASLAGDCLMLVENGDYSISFDFVPTYAGTKKYIADFKVEVVPSAMHPSYTVPLYKVYDLSDGSVETITPAMILAGKVGSWKWNDGVDRAVSGAEPVPFGDLIWTAVATGQVYKTDKLVMRYLNSAGDTGTIMGYRENPFTMPSNLYAAVFETTQKQWERVYGSAVSSKFIGDALPAGKVKYDDVRGALQQDGDVARFLYPNAPDPNSFLGKLRTLTTVDFDLPIHYQWYYAATAHSAYTNCSHYAKTGDPAETWNDGTPFSEAGPARYASSSPVEVGSYAPNMLGLYDTLGNVGEMSVDWWPSTQAYLRNTVKANANVSSTDYTLNYTDEASTLRLVLGGNYETAKNNLSFNQSDCRLSRSPSSGAETVGFRVFAPAAVEIGETAELVGAASGTSAGTGIFAKPDETYMYRTAPAGEFTLAWERPEGASSATLTVEGVGYSRTYPDLAGTTLAITLPAENVYTLTLAFDNSEVKTAKLGSIATQGASGTVAGVGYVSPSSARAWQNWASPAVLPIPAGATDFELDGTPVDPGLGGAAGWYALGLAGSQAKTLSFTLDGRTLEAVLRLTPGFLLLVR